MSADLADAWQSALASEHRAVFAYGLIGAHLHGSPELTLAIDCSHAHEKLRDATAHSLTAAGLSPVPAAADYPDLYPVTDAKQAASLAPSVEDDCAAAWRYLYSVAARVGSTAGTQLRTAAQSALTGSALRATKWRIASGMSPATNPFPGL